MFSSWIKRCIGLSKQEQTLLGVLAENCALPDGASLQMQNGANSSARNGPGPDLAPISQASGFRRESAFRARTPFAAGPRRFKTLTVGRAKPPQTRPRLDFDYIDVSSRRSSDGVKHCGAVIRSDNDRDAAARMGAN